MHSHTLLQVIRGKAWVDKILREERIRTRPSQIILQLAIILRITILSNDLNSETSVSYASCENCVKNENCANSELKRETISVPLFYYRLYISIIRHTLTYRRTNVGQHWTRWWAACRYPIRDSFRFLQNTDSHSPMWRDDKSCLVA